MKKTMGDTGRRLIYTIIFAIIQILFFLVMFIIFDEYFDYFQAISILISILAVMHIINSNTNPAYKIAWIIPIMLLPIFGGLFYVVYGNHRISNKTKDAFSKISYRYYKAMERKEMNHIDELKKINEDAGIQAYYIEKSSNAFVYKNTSTEYFPLGEDMFKSMIKELEKAEKFIFMEYFIIHEGIMWNSILEILKRKAEEGVDVRVMYDDFGCMATLPKDYDKKLEKMGIKACVFNKFTNAFSPIFNNRDHRKICVIDGNVGFTGGINLADEYINEVVRFGHWKDTAVMLKGQGVWGLTAMFLSMWNVTVGKEDDLSKFMPTLFEESDGYIQPFTDNPLDGEPAGETVYLNMINRAKRYVYISTPYLIIDNEMVTAMAAAAKSGIDVRIITPGIPDKKMVYALTRSHYPVLLESGVKIYEYTPGFIHSKTFVSDDDYGVVGTINLDYRSLYLHHECAVWMYKSKAVSQLKNDYMATLEKCTEVTLGSFKKKPLYKQLFLTIMRVFAPLL